MSPAAACSKSSSRRSVALAHMAQTLSCVIPQAMVHAGMSFQGLLYTLVVQFPHVLALHRPTTESPLLCRVLFWAAPRLMVTGPALQVSAATWCAAQVMWCLFLFCFFTGAVLLANSAW